MNAPTVQQLLNLADRAERGRLHPAEASMLRVGIQLLADRNRQNTATIDKLQDRIDVLREQARRVTPRQILAGEERMQTAKALRARYEAGETIRAIADDTGQSAYRTRDLLLLADTTMRPRGGGRRTTTTERTTT